MAGLSERAMIAKLNFRCVGKAIRDKNITYRVQSEILPDSIDPGRWLKAKFREGDLTLIETSRSHAKDLHYKMTSPFGDNGERLLPVSLVFEYMKVMGAAKREFESLRDELKNNWDTIVEAQRERLKGAFNPKDYPPKEKVDELFQFNLKIEPVPDWLGSRGTQHVIFNLEQDLARELIDQAKADERLSLMAAVDSLFLRMLAQVEKIAAYATRETCKVHSVTIERIEDEVKFVKELNFTGDADVEAIASQIKDKLCGWSVKQIRRDKILKRNIGLAAQTIAEKIRGRLSLGLPVA